MNLVLETFERVLYPGGGAAARRASTSGVPPNYAPRQQHAAATVSAISRRRSNIAGCSPRHQLMNCSNSSYATAFEPIPRGGSSERDARRVESPSGIRTPGTPGGAAAEASGGSGASSRSRSGARRKKSGCGHARKQSVASLLLAAISASAPTNRRRSRHPPTRQWSVPERGPSEGLPPDGAPEDEPPFQLVRKAPSVVALPPASPCGSSRGSQARTPPRRQLSGEEMGADSPSPLLLDSDDPDADRSGTPAHQQSVLLGFVAAGASASSARSARFARTASTDQPAPPHHGPSAESACLAQCGHIRQWPALARALLLRCMDPEPAFPYLHYALFDGGRAQSVEVAEAMNAWTGPNAAAHHTDFASFEEVIALERQMDGASSARPSGPSASSPHHGFIVMCFRVLDDAQQTGASSAQLESSWLSWTGAHEIYKYSPRAWQLRRLSLHRRTPPAPPADSSSASSSPLSFAYVLLCEFGAILHPAHALGALDMCERLRARNCGFVSLYQVRHSYGSPLCATLPPLAASNNSLSPHWSPHQLRRPPPRHLLARLGHSQDVPEITGAAGAGGGRRTVLLRMRERSLGWDMGGGAGSDGSSPGGTPL